jgi:plastocyanin
MNANMDTGPRMPDGRAWLAALWLAACAPACAGTFALQVTDQSGKPLEDAAVHLEPMAGRAPVLKPHGAEIEQKDRKFTQTMTVIQTGQAINFPNNDTVRHHVYSLSQAKLFELKLYSGVPASPVVFDKPGNVVIGCNIHDKMVAYIRIVDSPWHGKSDAGGRLRIEGVPDGQYRLKIWHYAQPNLDAVLEQVVTVKGDGASAAAKLEVRPGAR